MISIHAPRAGSDTIKAYWPMDGTISIHAPRAGSDDHYPKRARDWNIFQSTLPVRGATQPTPGKGNFFFEISIHAPRAGSDTAALCPFSDGRLFQSTLPVRGAT